MQFLEIGVALVSGEDDEVTQREYERNSPPQRVRIRETVVRHQREEPQEQNPRGDLRDLRAMSHGESDQRAARRFALLTLSSDSRSHGLYFWAIVNELTATAVAMVVLVVRFVKKTSIEVSSSRTHMRYAPYLRSSREVRRSRA